MISHVLEDKTVASINVNNLALLQYFSKRKNAKLTECKVESELGKYSVMQASIFEVVGTGKGRSRFLSSIKAIAECLERRFFEEYLSEKKDLLPIYKRNSNGFAVYFSSGQAYLAAYREAIERHLLQYTFQKDGWSGFYLKGLSTKAGIQIQQIVSKYQINGYAAGMILAKAKIFPGVAIGYFCDKVELLHSSERWQHAEFEAVDKIEPILSLNKNSDYHVENDLDQEMFKWFFEPFEMPVFVEYLNPDVLPELKLEVEIVDLQKKWHLDFPFFAARCDGEKLLPLMIPCDSYNKLDEKLSLILQFHGLPTVFPKRNPVL